MFTIFPKSAPRAVFIHKYFFYCFTYTLMHSPILLKPMVDEHVSHDFSIVEQFFFFSSIFKLGKIVCVLGMINMRTYWDNQCCAFKVAFGSLCHYGKISKALVLNKLHQLDI